VFFRQVGLCGTVLPSDQVEGGPKKTIGRSESPIKSPRPAGLPALGSRQRIASRGGYSVGCNVAHAAMMAEAADRLMARPARKLADEFDHGGDRI
jgi:hypothetical protein